MGVTAIFGGTFNPFHIGHYEMLESLCEQDFIDEVLVMPDKIPPHKECDFLASDKDRIAMCECVCSEFEKAALCLEDFSREGKSYSYYTVKSLKEKYPDKSFAFVCGGDMIASLDTWYNWQKLIRLIPFIAFCRADEQNFSEDVKRMREKGAEIKVINRKITDVSSTELRGELKKELIPECVYDYILRNGVYNAIN